MWTVEPDEKWDFFFLLKSSIFLAGSLSNWKNSFVGKKRSYDTYIFGIMMQNFIEENKNWKILISWK